ncbi:hypothetical protein [Niveispirillum sp.]|uniref:hypothetical protein n=1 Tax=Niveispirillum sp. TaxID=1917217 RepID=UPI001B52D53D|nr:hypothetical protein [Niveispirillum sp.]MBP7336591.1 hypothetical protein [Niveispirillum sp.]
MSMQQPDWSIMPAVRVDGLEAGRIVLEIAAGRPVRLVSDRGISGLAGAGWWADLQAAWEAEATGPVMALLDCADLPGLVLSALRAGCRDIAFTAGPATPEGVCTRLTSLAEAHGSRLHPAPTGVTEVCWRRNRGATLRQYLHQHIDFKQM